MKNTTGIITTENVQRRGGNFSRRVTLSTAFTSWAKAVEKFVIIPVAGQKPVYLVDPSRLDALEKAAAAADRHTNVRACAAVGFFADVNDAEKDFSAAFARFEKAMRALPYGVGYSVGVTPREVIDRICDRFRGRCCTLDGKSRKALHEAFNAMRAGALYGHATDSIRIIDTEKLAEFLSDTDALKQRAARVQNALEHAIAQELTTFFGRGALIWDILKNVPKDTDLPKDPETENLIMSHDEICRGLRKLITGRRVMGKIALTDKVIGGKKVTAK